MHIISCGKKWLGSEVLEGAEDGQVLGLGEGHSATFLLGRGQDGCLAEEPAGGSSIRTCTGIAHGHGAARISSQHTHRLVGVGWARTIRPTAFRGGEAWDIDGGECTT